MPVPANLVHQLTTGTGTGNLPLTAVPGKQTFGAAFPAGTANECDYFVSHRTAAEWEYGTAHVTAGALVRDTVIGSSNANAAVNFSAGTKDVTNDIPAAKQVTTDTTQTLTNKTLTTPIIDTVVGGTTASSPLVLKSTSGVGTSDYVSVVVGNNGATEAARFFTNGNMAINGGSIRTGALISTGDMQVELGGDRTGSGNVYMDFHATSGADYDARFLRGGGTNGTCSFNHKGTGKFIFGNEGAADMEFQTNAVQRLLINSSGNHFFPSASTTAAGANAYLWTGSSPANLLQRSTSSSVYKRDIEPLENNLGDLLLQMRPVWYRSKCENDNPNWSWYGLIAEDVAELDPRLVSWGYQDESWEIVQTPIPKMESDKAEQKFSITRELKADAKLVPDGVFYDRLTVLLIDLVQRLEARIAALEAASANQP